MRTTPIFICLLLMTGVSVWAEEAPPAQKPAAELTTQGAVAPITKGQHVFSCGHSFHFYVPAMLAEIAKSGGFTDHEVVGTSMIGGSKSIQHWNVKDENNKAKQALTAGTVDVLTLTPIYLPDEGVEKFAELGVEHNPNVRITVQEFWLPYDEYQPHYYDPPKIPKPAKVDHNAATVEKLREIHQRYFREMDELVRGVNQKVGKQAVFVVPVGQAVIALREKIIAGQAPGLKVQEELFTDMLGHPKPPLQALVTYCHYAVIYRKSPVGLPVPQALAKTQLSADDAKALNTLLQELAWDAVTHHELSGVKPQ
jgi:hypothetical protein